MSLAKGQCITVKATVCVYLFQVGADNVRSLYKRTLELDIEYKKHYIEYKRYMIKKKVKLKVEKLEYTKKVIQ